LRTVTMPAEAEQAVEISVRRIHRRDLNRTWEFLKLVFRNVNRETVEYQRPRTKNRFFDVYDDDDIEQLLFEADGQIVGYAECAFEISGSDNWLNPRYFEKRGMRPMFVEELAVHPDIQGRGVGGFMIEQLQHLARLRGCTHIVLEVAENNRDALAFYRHRNFFKLDAAIFMAQKLVSEPELLPPRRLPTAQRRERRPADDVDVGVLDLPDARAPEPSAGKVCVKAGTTLPVRPKRPSRKVRGGSGTDD
jgi:ribosomal protein S18 acetylase RimI-like enzyme